MINQSPPAPWLKPVYYGPELPPEPQCHLSCEWERTSGLDPESTPRVMLSVFRPDTRIREIYVVESWKKVLAGR